MSTILSIRFSVEALCPPGLQPTGAIFSETQWSSIAGNFLTPEEAQSFIDNMKPASPYWHNRKRVGKTTKELL